MAADYRQTGAGSETTVPGARPLRLAVFGHALAQETAQARWRDLAARYPVDVHLVVPRRWVSRWFGNRREFTASEMHDGRFHLQPLPTTSSTNWGKYLFVSADARLRSIRPDVIYVLHEEMVLVHQQILTYRRWWWPAAKYVFFTMHALGVPCRRWDQRRRWQRLRQGAAAAVGHYPGCLQSLRQAGFDKPVYLQTQVGVNEALFRPDPAERDRVRRELGWSGRFVIGFVGRLCRAKGVDTLLDALPLEGVDWSLLLVGDGELRGELERRVAASAWQGRVRLVGQVPLQEVPAYVRALDCLVLGSRTTPQWIDTFPLVTVQAMACGVPVIGSDSGAIPWQIRDCGLIFPEGDARALRDRILQLVEDPRRRRELAEQGRRHALANFCIRGMSERFYDILQQVHSGEWRRGLPDDDQRKAYLP